MISAHFSTFHPIDMLLDILFENSDIIIRNKPAGIVVHVSNRTTAPTLIEGISSHCKLSTFGNPLRPEVVHRLDKNRSGAMMLAKTDTAYLELVKMFTARKIQKTYQAIICAIFTTKFGEINFSIQRDRFASTKMSVSMGDKAAVTWLHVLKSFESQFAHLKVNIVTGRTHQIRVHISNIGHQILGDTTYGYNQNYAQLIIPIRMILHATELVFNHPCNGKTLTGKAQLP
jgi:23S rRNA pseudouridine1911/1915/1917 synthase